MNNADDLEKFSNNLSNRKYDSNVCFLCGRFLENLKSSDEHVIPKWAQNRFELWDKKLTLLMCAVFSYRSTQATRTPKYVTISDDPHKVIQLPLVDLVQNRYLKIGAWISSPNI